jgi:hypothetical protein
MVKGKDEGGMMKDECLMTHGEDFTGETVRVVKEKEVRLYMEYRTRCLLIRRILHEIK